MKETKAEIKWVDSCFHEGWVSKQSALTLPISHCTTVGMIINETKELITVALNASDSNNYGDVISIPRLSIQSIRRMK